MFVAINDFIWNYASKMKCVCAPYILVGRSSVARRSHSYVFIFMVAMYLLLFASPCFASPFFASPLYASTCSFLLCSFLLRFCLAIELLLSRALNLYRIANCVPGRPMFHGVPIWLLYMLMCSRLIKCDAIPCGFMFSSIFLLFLTIFFLFSFWFFV